MKCVHYDDKTKKIIGFYDKKIHKTIPEPFIEIEDNDWQQCLARGTVYHTVDNKRLIYTAPKEKSDSEKLKIRQNLQYVKICKKLQQTNQKVMRHLEQQILGIETTMTDSEFKQLLEERESVWVNETLI